MRSWSPRRPGPAGTGNARRVMLRLVLLCAHCVPPLHRGGTLRSSAAPRVRTPTQPVVFPHVHTPAASWVGDALRGAPGSDAGAAGRVPPCAHSRRLMGGDALRGAPGSDAGAVGPVPPCAHSRRLMGGGCPPRRPGFGRRRSRPCSPVCTLPPPHRAGDALRGAPGSDAGAAGRVPPCAHSRRLIGRRTPSAAPRVRTPAQPAVFPRVHTPVASSGGGCPPRRPGFGCWRSRLCSPVCTLPPPHGRGCPPRRPGFGRRRSRLCSPVCTLPSPHRAGGMPSATARVRMPAQPAVFPRVHTPAASWAGMPSAAPRVRTPAQPAVFPRVHTPVASSGGGCPSATARVRTLAQPAVCPRVHIPAFRSGSYQDSRSRVAADAQPDLRHSAECRHARPVRSRACR